MVPLEPQQKVLVPEEFLPTDHGEIGCENCHGGNPGFLEVWNIHKGDAQLLLAHGVGYFKAVKNPFQSAL